MDKKKMVIVASVALAVVIHSYARKQDIGPCAEIKTGLELSQRFCVGIGKKFSKKSCEQNGVEKENMDACIDLLGQVIASDCLVSLDLEDELSKYEKFCR